MKAEKLILTIALLVFPIVMFGQFSVTPQKSRLVLKDSTVIDGYLRSMPTNVDTTFFFSEKPHSKIKTYWTSRINYLEVVETDEDHYNPSPLVSGFDGYLVGIWAPMYVNNEIGEVGMVRPGLRLLMETYKGKFVNGYLGYDHFHGLRCYYKLHDRFYAKAFYPLKKMNDHRKKLLLQEFADYPELINKLSKGEISDGMISDNPFIILNALDKMLGTHAMNKENE